MSSVPISTRRDGASNLAGANTQRIALVLTYRQEASGPCQGMSNIRPRKPCQAARAPSLQRASSSLQRKAATCLQSVRIDPGLSTAMTAKSKLGPTQSCIDSCCVRSASRPALRHATAATILHS
eukprot:6206808-Pleurochrysis_carterae.AAC.2